MSGLLRRETKPSESVDTFDRMFDDWMRLLPLRRPSLLSRWMPEEMIRVDEFREDDDLVVRAEVPGIDPEKDIDLTVSDGMLHIEAERREEEKTEEKGYVRQEMRYGSFARSLPLPPGVTAADVTATYKDGILDIRIPTPKAEPGHKVPVSKG